MHVDVIRASNGGYVGIASFFRGRGVTSRALLDRRASKGGGSHRTGTSTGD
jgi:hypothetical protein